MRIGILGTGKVGSTLGGRLAEKGHDVTYGSRTPDAGSVSQQEAVRDAEVVVTAIPGSVVIETLEGLGEGALDGTVILDTSVAMNPDMTLIHPGDSVARLIQERFPNAHVVKTLNTMNVAVMIDPATKVTDPMVFVSGDDASAKATVARLLGDLGWEEGAVFDLGDIATAAGTENALWLFFATYRKLGTPNFTLSVSR